MSRQKGRGILFVLSAPSGAGKTTLANHAVKAVPNLKQSVSYTTRPKREGEVEGEHYHFVNQEEFTKMIEEEAFAEWARVHGNYYGTAFSKINEAWEKNLDLLLVIDVQGAAQLRKADIDMVSIFLLTPTMGELKNRLSQRGTDDPEIVDKRLEEATNEIAECGRYDYLILNDDLEEANKDIEEIIRAERLKLERKDPYMVDYHIPDLFLEDD